VKPSLGFLRGRAPREELNELQKKFSASSHIVGPLISIKLLLVFPVMVIDIQSTIFSQYDP